MAAEPEITDHDALERLGSATAEAVARTLEMFAPGEVRRGAVEELDPEAAFATVTAGSVAAGVSYVDGITGANVFLAPPTSARRLATLMGAPPPEDPDSELSELELSAVSEASNQMMAAAAGAIGVVLGHELEISPPLTQTVENAEAAVELFGTAPHAVMTTFHIGGEPCRLVQLVPRAFVARMARALDELSDVAAEAAADANAQGTDSAELARGKLTDGLGGMRLRVWTELGRTRLPLGEALALPRGAVLDLDRDAEEPIDLYVNGVRFARGRMRVGDDARWTFRLEELTAQAHGPAASPSLSHLTHR